MYKHTPTSCTEHFKPIPDTSIMYAGEHYIFDFWGASEYTDVKMAEAMIEAAEVSGATILNVHSHLFGDANAYTIMVILAESHISVHSYPEVNLLTFDIYTCGSTDPHKAYQFLKDLLCPDHIDLIITRRGQFHNIKV